MAAGGAAAIEALRAELALAKERARVSNAAALKAAEDLRAEHAAHCQSKKEMAKMSVKLKNATDRCKLLEKEDRVVQEDLKKATTEAKDACSAMRAMKEELRQAGDIAAGKPFLMRRKFVDPKMLSWTGCGVWRMLIWTWRQVPRTRPNTSEIKRITKWKRLFGHSSIIQSADFH